MGIPSMKNALVFCQSLVDMCFLFAPGLEFPLDQQITKPESFRSTETGISWSNQAASGKVAYFSFKVKLFCVFLYHLHQCYFQL